MAQLGTASAILLAGIVALCFAHVLASEQEDILNQNMASPLANAISFNSTCFRMKANVSFEFTDKNKKTYKYALPEDGQEQIVCDPHEVTFTYSVSKSWSYSLVFSDDKSLASDGNYAIKHILYNYDLTDLSTDQLQEVFHVNSTDEIAKLGIPLVETGEDSNKTSSWPIRAPVGKSYVCRNSDTRLPLDSHVSLVLEHLRVEVAFKKNTLPDNWTDGAECAADTTQSPWVPIVVGACLGLLVIAVLIGYLIGRARARRQGYASV